MGKNQITANETANKNMKKNTVSFRKTSSRQYADACDGIPCCVYGKVWDRRNGNHYQ